MRSFVAGDLDGFDPACGAVRPVLVCVRRSHQSPHRRRGRRPPAPHAPGARMTSITTPDKLSAPVSGETMSREISVAHSPDSDDAFMFYGLATNKVRVPGLRFTHT